MKLLRTASFRTASHVALILAAAITGCTHSGPTSRPASRPVLIDDARRAVQVQSFDQVWTTIHDQHWDPKLNGADWDGARAELRPKVEAAKTDAEARKAMMELIGRLHQSHFAIIPAEAYADLNDVTTQGGKKTPGADHGSAGVHIRVAGDDAVVVKVEPGSPAAAAGVMPGWMLVRAGKLDVSETLKRVRAAHLSSNLIHAYESLVVQGTLDGDVGSTTDATFRDGKGHEVKKSLVLTTPAGTMTKFGNLPTMYITAETCDVAPDIGYVAFSEFFDPARVNAIVRKAVDRPTPYRGLVLDLRGNPGGIGAMANGIAGYLVDEPNLKLGEMTMRTGHIAFVIQPQPVVYTGPLAVLVDECSMSTSEIMAAGLQDLGRARIFGTPTPGAALPSKIERLPNGDGFQYAFANYMSSKGEVLEGNGVKPDEVTPPAPKALLAGHDPALDAAVKWLQNQPANQPATRPTMSSVH